MKTNFHTSNVGNGIQRSVWLKVGLVLLVTVGAAMATVSPSLQAHQPGHYLNLADGDKPKIGTGG